MTRRSAAAAAACLLASALPLPAEARAPEKPRVLERAAFSSQEGAAARVLRIPDARFAADSAEEFRDAVAAAPAAQSQPWLALSTGGENGAFSAGLLGGWTKAGTRPTFGVVTGVSTGALIAPFAFAGPAYDGFLKEAYTSITAADVFEFGGKGESLVDTWPLKRLIERHVTPKLLADVAAEHGKGRRLFIITTNVDSQRPVAWNMGAIAAEGSPKARQLFVDILLASSSIPGLFPPVYIDVEANGRRFQEMHADGGVTTPFFVAPEPVLFGLAGTERIGPATKVFVVVNNQLNPDFQVTDRMLLTILGRSLSAAVKAGTRAAIMAHFGFAKRRGIELELAHIDDRFAVRTNAPFDPAYMKALYEHGMALATAGTAFATTPPGAAPKTSVAQR